MRTSPRSGRKAPGRRVERHGIDIRTALAGEAQRCCKRKRSLSKRRSYRGNKLQRRRSVEARGFAAPPEAAPDAAARAG